MYSYETRVTWEEGKQASIHAGDKAILQVAAPPEFGGPEDMWSPEELLVASVGSCLMTTFLYFIELLKIRLVSCESNASGAMEKTPDGLRFTAMDVAIAAKVKSASDYQKTTELKKKLEKYCPVSTSLNFPVRLSLEVRAAG